MSVSYKFRHSGTWKVKQRPLLSIKIAYGFCEVWDFHAHKAQIMEKGAEELEEKR